ncbi:nickel-type superoxide dismutase maturation protease [Streptomyces sp. NPDC004647]|uniref:nickel-type superoxide dismutase maturation protease n=1 Tax=Streptomyces sp. NPDC004647 TaxID=3154671 RepID=UPI0033B9FFA3
MPEGGRWQGYEDGRELGPEHVRERRGALPYGLAEVVGPSMVPTLQPGDRLVVRYGAPVRPGGVVVLRHPMQQDLLIVKRAVERREGGWWVLGDNPFVENDSREFGAVPDELVLARARVRLRPPSVLKGHRSPVALLSWIVSAVCPVRSDRSLSRRLRAR